MNDIEKLENTLRAGGVCRWHTTPEIPPQNVAAHSWGVAVICMYLGEGDFCGGNAAANALIHDIAEFFTGDIPAPFRAQIENTEAFKAVEAEFSDRLFMYRPEVPPITQLADKLEALRWTHEARAHEINAQITDCIFDKAQSFFIENKISSRLFNRVAELIFKWELPRESEADQ